MRIDRSTTRRIAPVRKAGRAAARDSAEQNTGAGGAAKVDGNTGTGQALAICGAPRVVEPNSGQHGDRLALASVVTAQILAERLATKSEKRKARMFPEAALAAYAETVSRTEHARQPVTSRRI